MIPVEAAKLPMSRQTKINIEVLPSGDAPTIGLAYKMLPFELLELKSQQ